MPDQVTNLHAAWQAVLDAQSEAAIAAERLRKAMTRFDVLIDQAAEREKAQGSGDAAISCGIEDLHLYEGLDGKIAHLVEMLRADAEEGK